MRKFSFLLMASVAALCSCTEPAEPEKKDESQGPEEKPEKYVDGTTVIGERKAIDMGSGILWAEVNIGAGASHEYGDYFSWGEVSPKQTYTWANYKWGDGTAIASNEELDKLYMTKYCMFAAYGDKDGKSVLESSDDAASVMWKDGWRMPTYDEIVALYNNSDWNWIRVEGIYGYEITSKVTGKSIFLPGASSKIGEGYGLLNLCTYWTSSLFARNEQYYAYSFGYPDEPQHISNTFRYIGMTVRPVHDKQK